MYTTDWHILIRKYRRRTRLIRKLFKLSNRLHLNKYFADYLAKLWIEHSQILVDEAILLFSKYNKVFTDRLYAHILSCLMDKKHMVYDNSYGKNINYIKCWTIDSPLVTIGEENE
ncbi:MAG: hypothetical protein IE909_10305 [Campylobacterales bacterium]|nr:hypothetical protein [Campylobacterales bacterium]